MRLLLQSFNEWLKYRKTQWVNHRKRKQGAMCEGKKQTSANSIPPGLPSKRIKGNNQENALSRHWLSSYQNMSQSDTKVLEKCAQHSGKSNTTDAKDKQEMKP